MLESLALTDDGLTQWALPLRLLEISALAMTADGRLLAVDDERAVIYELDYAKGGLVKAFAFGKPVLTGDFEGLAVAGGRIYLMDSRGDLFAAREGEDGERVDFEEFETDLDDECEFEGLASRRGGNQLLLLCKDVLKKADIDSLTIFAWDIDTARVVESESIRLPMREISMALRTRRLHPSGITVDARSGHLLVVAAQEHALIELDAEGGFVSAVRVPRDKRHPQMEGIELTADGRLVLSDEGGNGKARLSVYGRRDSGDPGAEDSGST